MADIQRAIYDRLAGDSRLTAVVPVGLQFTLLNRWPTRSAPGATPTAFKPDGSLKRLVIVLDGGEVEHPSGATQRQFRWDSFPTLHIVAEAHDTGRWAVKQADQRIAEILSAALLSQTTEGATEQISFRLDGTVGPREDFEGFPGSVRMIRRWRATGTRRLAS